MELSICIPTHSGRRAELAHALGVIFAQLRPADHGGRVEICIADNASTDGTQALVEGLAAEHPGVIRYLRHEEDQGAPANVLAAVALSQGTWCWLHSSDDALAPGALDAMLARLGRPDASGLAGLSVGRATFDAALRHELDPEPGALLPRSRAPHVYGDPREALVECGLLQTHLTALIVRRSAWADALARDPRAPLTVAPMYPHAYLVGRALLAGAGAWAWEPRKLVFNRSGNTSLARSARELVTANVLVSRQLSALWRELLGDGPALRALLERARQVWADPWWLTEVKNGPAASRSADRELLGLAPALWRAPRFWTRTLPYLLIPHPWARRGRALRLRLTPMRPIRPMPPGSPAAAIGVALPTEATAGADLELAVSLHATRRTLRSHPPAPVHLAVDWIGADGSTERPTRLVMLARPSRPVRRGRVQPSAVALRTAAPWAPGTYRLRLALVQSSAPGGAVDDAATDRVTLAEPGGSDLTATGRVTLAAAGGTVTVSPPHPAAA